MRIRRFIGSTTKEAMNKVKLELGSEAVILHERKIKKKGLFSLFKKPFVEVVVAIDEKGKKKKTQHKVADVQTKIVSEKNELNKEIKELRDSINQMMKQMNKESQKVELPESLLLYYNYMMDKGVNDNVAFEILKDINTRINITNKNDEQIKKIVEYELKEHFGAPKPIELNGETKTIFFVGPTGVGKTTTIAKIAADYAFNQNKDVGVISADTYRIAAVEQIKTYCEIMNLPLKVVYQKDDIYESLASYKDKDIIFVDTAGRSHKDTNKIDETMSLIREVKNKEIYLVLSSTTSLSTVKSIIKTYKNFGEYKLIFTKLDECENPGVILNTKYLTNNPLSYVTTGQNVPEDIQLADVTTLVNTMIGG
ncbi:flagellar biosynthesis protein FlhF [Clostridiaceae bacterium M8S5]|nr:flagellar biosynthesis protein FlhF [Clostridiaceae bacterium M8S5]